MKASVATLKQMAAEAAEKAVVAESDYMDGIKQNLENDTIRAIGYEPPSPDVDVQELHGIAVLAGVYACQCAEYHTDAIVERSESAWEREQEQKTEAFAARYSTPPQWVTTTDPWGAI